MRFDIITIFPEIFYAYLNESIMKRAIEKKIIEVKVHNLRDFTTDRHKQVDDYPYGGQTWTSGIQYNITWATYETVRPVRKVELFYTTNAGTTWNLIGRIKGSNPGEYLWTAPDVRRLNLTQRLRLCLKMHRGM